MCGCIVSGDRCRLGGAKEEIPGRTPAQGTGGVGEAAQREQRRRRVLRRRLGMWLNMLVQNSIQSWRLCLASYVLRQLTAGAETMLLEKKFKLPKPLVCQFI